MTIASKHLLKEKEELKYTAIMKIKKYSKQTTITINLIK